MKNGDRRACQTSKFFLLFAAVLMGAAAVNAFICFSGTGKYAVTENGAVSTDVINAARVQLAGIDSSDYPEALSEIYGRIDSLTEYSEAKKRLIRGSESVPYLGKYTRAEAEEISGRYDFSEKETADRIALLSYCAGRLEYSLGYRDFLDNVNRNAENMSRVSIFEGSISKRAAKVRSDFYGLENIRISPDPEEGVLTVTESVSGAWIALAAAAVCGVLFAVRAGEAFGDIRRIRTYPAGFAAVFTVGICLVFGVSVLGGEVSAGLGELSRAVQSVGRFRSCAYPISVGTFIFIGVICSTVTALSVYLFTVGLVCCRGNCKRILVAVAAVVFELFAAAWELPFSLPSLMLPWDIMGKYGQTVILGEALSPGAVMAAGLCLRVILWSFFAARSLKGLENAALEKAQADYFRRISDRCTEARQIRHDIGNHLTAIAALLDSGDVDRARRYLGDVTDELLCPALPAATGSKVLDMLLFYKREEMQRMGIALQAELTADVSRFGISDYDLCVIFGNILDNAVEAVAILADGDRAVQLVVRGQMDMLLIFCKNKYIGETPSAVGFATAKRDKSFHGQGLSGIRRTVRKYGGDISISDEGGVFEISVIINGKP